MREILNPERAIVKEKKDALRKGGERLTTVG